MWRLAVKAMLGDRTKLLTSLLGVAFSVALVNLQAGLFLGLIHKASLLVDFGRADIWVGHKHTSNVEFCDFIKERKVQRIRNVPDVECAEPYVVMFSKARMPDGASEDVVVVGCAPVSLLGGPWGMVQGDSQTVIRHPEGISIDECDRHRFGNCRIGDTREVNGRRARVVGMTRGIVSFTTNPYIFTTLERARQRYAYGVPADACSYFLVKVRPGADVVTVCQEIRQRVPELDVYDRDTYSWMCMKHWLTRTGIGISFGLATLLGLMVGLGVVAQTLYASVTERLKEFGTLKALGADEHCVARFLLAQALGSALAGSVVGLIGAVLLAALLSSPRAPVELTGTVAVGSVVLIVLVCVLATWLPYWRVRRIDPASVLRG